jgi:SH3 domain-containing YSC84-like protein 1
MRRITSILLLITTSVLPLASHTLMAQSSEADVPNIVKRTQSAAEVLEEIMGAPDQKIPREVLDSAEGVAIVPSMFNAGIAFGGRYGRGVASCRTTSGWSGPAPYLIAGGSWGLQIGAQAVDLVMLVMNENGVLNLLSSKFKIGADASAAAGPVGRHVAGGTDWKMRAQILTYSRARGVFAGVTLNGAVIKQDKDATKILYGRLVPFESILKGVVPAPESTAVLTEALEKYAPVGKNHRAGTTNRREWRDE